MIVNDEHDIVNAIKAALESQGCLVEGYTNPLVAMQEFRKNDGRYVLVISDIRMPAMNGFELARKIRSASPEVALVLMTAFEIHKTEFSSLFPSTMIFDLRRCRKAVYKRAAAQNCQEIHRHHGTTPALW